MSAQPETIGPYRILRPIGAGGMGVVYRAQHARSGTQVALKTVRVPHQRMLASIRREIYALSRVRHPGVVQILDQGAEGARPWYAMELLEGASLEKFLRDVWEAGALANARSRAHTNNTDNVATQISFERPVAPRGDRGDDDPESVGRQRTLRPPAAMPMPDGPPAAGGRLTDVLTVFVQLCETLSYLHGEGIVHRDLKPANVLVRDGGEPVILDFGLVSRSPGAPGREVLDAEGRSLAGTPEYMAPEQILGEWTDARADLYALGCMLFEAVAGTLPFHGANAAQIFEKQLLADPPAPSSLASGIPPALDQLVLRMLAKRPRQRPGHADDVAATLIDLGARASERHGSPQSAPRAYLYRAELQGREAALDRFREWTSEAARGHGRCVLLAGDSGSGKTYLGMEFVRLAHERGFRTIAGECVSPDAGPGAPFACFARLLHTIADHCAEEGPEGARRLLGARAGVLAALDPVIAQLPGLENIAPPPELPPQAAQERLLDALTETVGALADDQPLVLTLDDAQWVDELSVRFLVQLCERTLPSHRVIVLVMYRSDDAGNRLAPLATARGAERVDLAGLDREQVGALVGSMLALADAPAGFVEFLARRSSGNPFFVAEYLRAAVEAGVLRRDDAGRWLFAAREDRASLYESLDLPGSLHALVERRLDSLTPDAARVCRAGAALGGGFDAALLASAAGCDEATCAEALRELVARGVLEESETGGVYRFVQGRYREIAYGRVARGEIPALHRSAGLALAARYDGAASLAAPYPELAHHFRLAGDATRALGYLEKSAEQALRAFANRDAVRYLNEALALARDAGIAVEDSRRACWERQIGEALLGIGEVRESREHLDASLRLLGFPRPASNGGLTAELFAQAARQLRTRLGLSGKPPASRETLLEAARAYDKLNQGFFHTGEPLPIFHATLAILNLAESVGPSPELVMAYANAHGAAALVPLRGLAETYARAGENALSRAPDPVAETWLRLMTGMSALSAADWPRARERLGRAAELAEALGFRRRWEESAGTLAGMHFLRGEFEASRALVARYAESVKRGDAQGRVWALMGTAQHHTLRGELTAAEENLALVRPLTESDPTLSGAWYWGTAMVLLRRGDVEGAAQASDRAVEPYSRRPPLAYFDLYVLDGVLAARIMAWERARSARSGDASARERKVRESLRALERFVRPFAIAEPALHLRRGEFHAVRGDAKNAQREFDRAIACATEREMGYYRALAERALAERMIGDEARRGELRARAMAFFAQSGATADLEEMRRRE